MLDALNNTFSVSFLASLVAHMVKNLLCNVNLNLGDLSSFAGWG